MLWLCIYLPQLSLEALAPPEDHPVAVIVAEKNKRRIVACNRAATDIGLSNATLLTTALAIYPQLRILERNAQAELAALKRLAAWAYQWSSRITWQEATPQIGNCAATLWLEIGASQTLFGGYSLLIEQLEHSLQLLHYTYSLGVAPTLEGAALLARAGKRVLITSQQHMLLTIRELALVYLALSNSTVYALQRSGITCIGSLLDLPAAALARRFGPDTTFYLERLCGNAPDPRPAYRLPKRYRGRCEFGFGIGNVEALLFPLQRMLQEFCGYLRAMDVAIQHCILILEHERRCVTRIVMGLAAPSRDAERLFSIAREKLHTLSLAADVYGLRIEAQEFTPPAVRQRSLFAGDAEIADELQQVLEKISARLGQNAVRQLQTVADHRPEHAWQFIKPSTSHSALPLTSARPLWLLSQPCRLQNPPSIGAQLERIEGGWWSASIKRDYYIAHLVTGEQSWVFFDQNERHWYRQGYWA